MSLHGGDETNESSISQAAFVSMGCSDGSLRLVSVDCESATYTNIEEIDTNFTSDSAQETEEKDAVLHHEINNCANKAICGTQSGSICLVDIEAG